MVPTNLEMGSGSIGCGRVVVSLSLGSKGFTGHSFLRFTH